MKWLKLLIKKRTIIIIIIIIIIIMEKTKKETLKTKSREKSQRRIRSGSVRPTPFESGWPAPPRTFMFDWACTHSLTYAVLPQLTLAPGLFIF
jgi:hypothetical protein